MNPTLDPAPPTQAHPTQKTLRLGPHDSAEAAAILAKGGVVALPTETVYGLAGDATNARAVAAIYTAKGRPSFNPLIVHVPSVEAIDFAVLSDEARALATAFWPGPLTMVLPLKQGGAGQSAAWRGTALASLVTAGLSTVAVRVPAHPVMQAVLKELGRPLAAPSANPSGRISPVTAAHVLAGLDGRIAAVVDGGRTGVGVESTIIGWPDGRATLLRPGGLAGEDIAALIGPLAHLHSGAAPVHAPTGQPPEQPSERPSAPGQLASHYAPRALVTLNVIHPVKDSFHIGFGPVGGDVNLSPASDLTEAAANLFDALHLADATGRPISVAPIPDHGLGAAINDRLLRASAPRPDPVPDPAR